MVTQDVALSARGELGAARMLAGKRERPRARMVLVEKYMIVVVVMFWLQCAKLLNLDLCRLKSESMSVEEASDSRENALLMYSSRKQRESRASHQTRIVTKFIRLQA